MKDKPNYLWLVNAALYAVIGVWGLCTYIPTGSVACIITSVFSLVTAAVWALMFFKDRG